MACRVAPLRATACRSPRPTRIARRYAVVGEDGRERGHSRGHISPRIEGSGGAILEHDDGLAGSPAIEARRRHVHVVPSTTIIRSSSSTAGDATDRPGRGA